MSPEEYSNLDRVEQTHWYYAGKREIVEYWINFHGATRGSLLDCGAGSGAFALAMSKSFEVHAMDDHAESLEILKQRLPIESVVVGSCIKIPYPDDSFDVVTALDVLEHIPDDGLAVREMIRVLKPGGQFVITVPAMMALWSDWDVSLHHQRRYSKKGLLAVFANLPIDICYCGYINVFALPIVWLLRKIRAIGFWPYGRAEDSIPPAIVNRILQWLFVAHAKSGIQVPFGVGLLLCGTRVTEE